MWPFDTTEHISAFSVVVALCAAALTAFYASRNLKINIVSARIKYFEEFQKWADQLVNALTEAIHLCDLDPKRVVGESFFDRRHRLRITFSAMIDKGRWFFPNIQVDDHGTDKELGYRGYRHELLEGLVKAYRCLQRLDFRNPENNKTVRNDLTDAKRHFVGEVQKIIDPISQRSEFDKIHSRFLYRSRVKETEAIRTQPID
jgi:hypothetical protein